MTPRTWRITLHTTDHAWLTWSLSSFTWAGDRKAGHGLSALSTCGAADLPAVLDQLADMVLHEIRLEKGGQPPLPPF